MIHLAPSIINSAHPIRSAFRSSTFKKRIGVWGVFLLTGCAALSTPPSLLATRVMRIHEALQSMAESYTQKEMTRILFYFDPALKQHALYQESIQQDFENFDMTLNMHIQRVNAYPDRIWTEVAWEGTWTKHETASSPMPFYQAGYVHLGWSLDESPRLIEIRGDLPWGVQSMDTK